MDSVSTGRHRHQLVCSSVWLSGCQSVRNSKPPGKIRFKSHLNHVYMKGSAMSFPTQVTLAPFSLNLPVKPARYRKQVLPAAAAAAYSMQPSVEMGLHCAHRRMKGRSKDK